MQYLRNEQHSKVNASLMKTIQTQKARKLAVAASLAEFERLIMAVRGQGGEGSKIGSAQAVLKDLSLKEGIPLAFIGGLAAIFHGYERTTKDIDVVVPKGALDAIIRVAPKYRIKVLWQDPDGWHKLHYGGVAIDIVPEGGKPQRHAPTTIPGPKQLGVAKGADYAALPGWVETKLASNRIQDRADVVQVIKRTAPTALAKIRNHLAKVHGIYVRRFEDLHAAAEQEMKQEQERGGPRS